MDEPWSMHRGRGGIRVGEGIMAVIGGAVSSHLSAAETEALAPEVDVKSMRPRALLAANTVSMTLSPHAGRRLSAASGRRSRIAGPPP